MRKAGGRAVVDLSGRGLKKQIKAASDGGFSYAVIIGADEMERGAAAVKDLSSGEQEEVPFSSLSSYLVDGMKKGRL